MSWSPSSESIVVVNTKDPAPGFTNTLEKVSVWELPLVVLFPSATPGDAEMLTPGFVFSIVKVPSDKPVLISSDCTTTSSDDTILSTINWVIKVLPPLLADKSAVPITSPTLMLAISNEPVLDANKATPISGSLASWLTVIVKSDKLSQSVLDNTTETEGVKAIQATAPVFPPTQFPQLSITAEPFTSPLQSKFWAIRWEGFANPINKTKKKLYKLLVKKFFIIIVLIILVVPLFTREVANI